LRKIEITRSWPIFGYYPRNCLKRPIKRTETTDIEVNKTDSWGRVFLEKLVVFQLINNFLVFFETRSFVTVFTKTCHLSLLSGKIIRSVSVRLSSRPDITWCHIMFIFYCEELLAPHRSPNWSTTTLFSFRDCLLNVFVATIYIWNKYIYIYINK
jgi:hypothetical protein